MDYIDILMDDEDDTEEDSNSLSPSISSKNEAVLSRLDSLAQARKAARLVALLKSMLQQGTLRLDSEVIPAFLVDAVKRKQASELNTKAFNQWLNTLSIVLADNSLEWLELNELAIQAQTYRTLGTESSGKAYQLCRKKLAYYRKQLAKEHANGDSVHHSHNLTPYGVWFAMCEALLHSALNARLNETIKNAELISERSYGGSKCKYHLDVSGQAKSDFKRVVHNTGTNASAYDRFPTDERVPVRQPPKIVRKLNKVRQSWAKLSKLNIVLYSVLCIVFVRCTKTLFAKYV